MTSSTDHRRYSAMSTPANASPSSSNIDPGPHPHHLADKLEPMTFETRSDATVSGEPVPAGEREKTLGGEEKGQAGTAVGGADDYPDGGFRAWRYVPRLAYCSKPPSKALTSVDFFLLPTFLPFLIRPCHLVRPSVTLSSTASSLEHGASALRRGGTSIYVLSLSFPPF